MANSKPLVSIILPFYNAHYLKDAIESILNQTFTNFELILINNASTDNSLAIANSYASDARISILHETKRGVVHAANAGIKAANGELIARMDADDVAFPHRLQCQIDFLNTHKEIGMVSGKVEYLGSSENKGFITYVNWLNEVITPKQIALSQFIEFPIANPSIMVRKSVLEKHGLYADGDFPEDYEFFLRLQEAGVQMGKVDKPVLYWRDTEQRLTRTDPRYSSEAFYKVKSRYLASWLEKNNPFHPRVWIWGAGRLSRKRSCFLKEHGIEIEGYIDVKQGKGDLHYTRLPQKDQAFILSYVANRGARNKIRHYLIRRNFVEGKHFILAS